MTVGVPPDIRAALLAVDALNAYARGQGHRVVPERVVYALKDRAIRVLSDIGCAVHRRVVYESPCRNCGGDGMHRRPGMREWGYDEVGERCRTCTATGKNRMHFVETTIATADAPVVWHSPALFGENAALGTELWHRLMGDDTDPRGWAPRSPGLTLDAPTIARRLLTAEAWLLPTWLFPPALLSGYALDLGDAGDVTICAKHGEILGSKQRVSDGRVRWLTRVCPCAGCGWFPAHDRCGDLDIMEWWRAHPGPIDDTFSIFA